MILIADSGSSKTDWRILNTNSSIGQLKTDGINPYFEKEEEIFEKLNVQLKSQIRQVISEIYFYGTGCTDDKKPAVKNAIKRCFPKAKIHVENDMLAAARSLCNHEKGIACILGTGANSCLYDGRNIVRNLRSFGFLLGDEGSGAYLGKQLIINYLRGDLPDHLSDKFDKRFQLSENEIMENVYAKPFPNRFLASFSKFLFDHHKDPYIYKLIYDGFTLFFDKNVLKYENARDCKVHFVGSIAFYYANILRQAGQDKGIIVKNILESPIAGLTLFHNAELN